MTTPNQITETENAAAISPVDPFAVDFFGGSKPLAEDEGEFSAREIRAFKRIKPRQKSDWHKNLPRAANREAEFSNLLANLPENLTENAAKIICRTLARYTYGQTESLDCSVMSVREVNLTEAVEKAGEQTRVFLTIGGRNTDSTAIAALNADFASAMIDSILGGQEAEVEKRRGISPIETTIIEFLASQILREINENIGDTPLYLRNASTEPTANFESFERGAEIVLSVSAGKANGAINLFAPQKFLAFLDNSQNPLFAKKTNRKTLSEFEKIARAVDFRLQIGATSLDADSLFYLEPEDIVLIEQPQISMANGNFSGDTQIFAGRGVNFRLRGFAEPGDAGGGLNFRIEEIISEEARRKFSPAKFNMDVSEEELEEDVVFRDGASNQTRDENLDEDEQISPALENVQVALRVEIAGNKISLRELQNLRAGQIIALGVSPADPVRLITDAREEPLATGELIEIEGQLGVRLTKVFI